MAKKEQPKLPGWLTGHFYDHCHENRVLLGAGKAGSDWWLDVKFGDHANRFYARIYIGKASTALKHGENLRGAIWACGHCWSTLVTDTERVGVCEMVLHGKGGKMLWHVKVAEKAASLKIKEK